jgi:hypothetical protein
MRILNPGVSIEAFLKHKGMLILACGRQGDRIRSGFTRVQFPSLCRADPQEQKSADETEQGYDGNCGELSIHPLGRSLRL